MADFPGFLLNGYRSFKDSRYAREHGRYRSLAVHGQTPEVMVIACCDSRSAPETIFDAAPGEIFVVRNVANMVPPYEPDGAYHGTSAALEFAVQSLKVRSSCLATAAAAVFAQHWTRRRNPCLRVTSSASG